MMLPLPIDSIPHFCPSWDEIKGKAHMYRTARIRKTGQIVSILYVLPGFDGDTGLFAVRAGRDQSSVSHLHTEELCDFCL